MITYDPNLTVPIHVIEAARIVEVYFKEQGITSWELYGLCSRDRLAESEAVVDEMRKIVKAFKDAANEIDTLIAKTQ